MSKCAGLMTLNNTYFQSSSSQLITPTLCTLTVKLDKRLAEQRQAICQVRLDFVSFILAQPSTAQTTGTQCLTDTFQVSGALNAVPTICGENNGQHMYLHVPRSDSTPSDVLLTFNIGTGPVSRAWNIKIVMIPCASANLAPADCLQYYTASSGTVQSFNWKDVAATAVRQLANQDYKICFRSEIVNNQRANSMCITPCTTTAAGASAFSMSAPSPVTTNCLAPSNDFLVFVNGVNSADSTKSTDRFCGSALNADGTATTSTTVCSTAQPFEIYYKTANAEAVKVANFDQGFCLTYQQHAV